MIAQSVTTQAAIDKALLDNFGLKPTGNFTKDRTQQLYINAENKPFILPASNQGYSYYSVADILAHVQQISTGVPVVGIHTFVASDKAEKPELKLVKKKTVGDDKES